MAGLLYSCFNDQLHIMYIYIYWYYIGIDYILIYHFNQYLGKGHNISRSPELRPWMGMFSLTIYPDIYHIVVLAIAKYSHCFSSQNVLAGYRLADEQRKHQNCKETSCIKLPFTGLPQIWGCIGLKPPTSNCSLISVVRSIFTYSTPPITIENW